MAKLIRFGLKIQRLRKERGISLEKFLDDTGMDRKFMYPCYTSIPHKARLMALAYYFNTTVEDLVSGTDIEEYFVVKD